MPLTPRSNAVIYAIARVLIACGGISFSVDVLAEQILFVSERDGTQGLYSASLEEGYARKLTDFGGYGLSLSPDGRMIAYVGSSDRVNTIWIMNADGSNRRMLLPIQRPPGNETIRTDFSDPNWSPCGNKIACVGRGPTKDGESWFLYVAKADGTNLARIDAVSVSGLPAWSPDETRIAISNYENSKIVLIDLETKQVTELFDAPANRWVEGCSWSPDGKTIAFFVKKLDVKMAVWIDRQISLMTVEDSSVRTVPREITLWVLPRWSPDSKRLVFAGRLVNETSGSDIFVMNADGSNVRNITNDPGWDGSPIWLPISSSTGVSPARKVAVLWSSIKKSK